MTEYPNITTDPIEQDDVRGFGGGRDADRSFSLLTGASLGVPPSLRVITDTDPHAPWNPSRQAILPA